MSRRRTTFSPDEMSTCNIEMASRPSKVSTQVKDDARALHILGGIYEPDAEELARAARTVRRIAPADAEVILDVLGLSEAS
jgi:hypothetical protein